MKLLKHAVQPIRQAAFRPQHIGVDIERGDPEHDRGGDAGPQDPLSRSLFIGSPPDEGSDRGEQDIEPDLHSERPQHHVQVRAEVGLGSPVVDEEEVEYEILRCSGGWGGIAVCVIALCKRVDEEQYYAEQIGGEYPCGALSEIDAPFFHGLAGKDVPCDGQEEQKSAYEDHHIHEKITDPRQGGEVDLADPHEAQKRSPHGREYPCLLPEMEYKDYEDAQSPYAVKHVNVFG